MGRSLFQLFEHPSMAIVKAAGLIMKAIIEEGSQEMCERMQALSLAEGSLPRHLHTALFTQSLDNRLLTHRQLSRHLVGLWLVNNTTGMALLGRILVCVCVRACVCVCVCVRVCVCVCAYKRRTRRTTTTTTTTRRSRRRRRRRRRKKKKKKTWDPCLYCFPFFFSFSFCFFFSPPPPPPSHAHSHSLLLFHFLLLFLSSSLLWRV